MKQLITILLLSCSLSLLADDNLPQLKDTPFEVIGMDELTLSTFNQDDAPLSSFSHDFKNYKLTKDDGRWVLISLEVIAIAGGLAIDAVTIVNWVALSTSAEPIPTTAGWIIGGALVVGTGIIVLGAFAGSKAGAKPPKKSSKQKQFDSIKKFEGY